MTTTMQTETLAALAQRLRGELIAPGHDAYDEARRVWNGMFDCRPAAIAQVQGADDVVAVVDWARETGTELAVRGGGHSSAGYSTVDGGIVLDFSRMKARPRSTRRRRRRAPRPGRSGATSTARRRSTASPSRAGRSRTPASPG